MLWERTVELQLIREQLKQWQKIATLEDRRFSSELRTVILICFWLIGDSRQRKKLLVKIAEI